MKRIMSFDNIETPCFIVDEERLESNLKILKRVMQNAGCKILLAQKAFSMFSLYPLIGKYLSGATASGLYEAKLGAMMQKENHVFCTAFKDGEFDEVAALCSHITFNSFSQISRFAERAKKAGASVGIRINPEHSTQEGHEIYDPCAKGSRLGVTKKEFNLKLFNKYVDGIHMHTLCEQDAMPLKETVDALIKSFDAQLKQIKWLNLGGGHHITKKGYNIELLEQTIISLKKRYGIEIYLEPGEAVALSAGYLVGTVLDIVKNDSVTTAVLDVSAACHMPDVIEMPYRPPLINSGERGEKKYDYRLAGATCLAGDVIGDYSFDKKLEIGGRLVFEDMAIYSMVKTNTFNGMPLPSINVLKDGKIKTIKTFSYEDFKNRLS